MKVILAILTVGLSSLCYAVEPQTCTFDKMQETTEFNSVPVRNLKSATRYLKIDNINGECATTLHPVNESFASDFRSVFVGSVLDISSRYFSMKTEGRDYCVENGSVWEVLSSGHTMKTAFLILGRMDQPQAEPLRFTTSYESSMASAQKSGLRALKCRP